MLDVCRTCATHDHRGAPVNHAVPDLSVLIEGFVPGAAYLPADLIPDPRYKGSFLHVRKLIPNDRGTTEWSGEYLVSEVSHLILIGCTLHASPLGCRVRHCRTCGLEGNQNGNRYQWNFTEGSRKPAYFDKRKTLKR